MNDETIYNNVIEVLKDNEEARDSDTILTLNVLEKMGFGFFDNDFFLLKYKKQDLPTFESIRRLRQKIQNEENLYPPSKTTQNKREKAETEFKMKYGNTAKVNAITYPNSHLMPEPKARYSDYW